jgi:ERCC4-type nuclease
MKLFIDLREPQDIIDNIKKYCLNNPKYEVILCNLPLFDYIVTTNDFDVNNFQNNLENILLAVERKSEKDLLASIKDGRYKEQSFRMENLKLDNEKIYYLIEENNVYEKKLIYSAYISLSYFKKFSLIFSKNKLDTSYLIYKFLEKISANNNLQQNSIVVNTSDSNINNDNNIINTNNDILENNNRLQNNNTLQNKNYLTSIKVNKKDNITPDNIDIVMLMQIPSISSNIATSLIEKYNSIQNLINTLRKNENILQNFKINERKISKNVVENLKKYLHI